MLQYNFNFIPAIYIIHALFTQINTSIYDSVNIIF